MTQYRAPFDCQKCRALLEEKATSCVACGWKAKTEDLVPVVNKFACDLTHMCERPAKASVIVEDKRVNCCLGCLAEFREKELREWNSPEAVARRERIREKKLHQIEAMAR